jgi:ubiquinone/menaquinone biosynthesis C-methylase UbiE
MSTQELFDKYYFLRPQFATGISQFQNLLIREIPAGAKVLEIGAGPSNPMSQFLATHFHLEGVDVSNEVIGNAFLRRAWTYDGECLPFQAKSFDACVSYYVIEHVADPAGHFREAARVLHRGGAYFLCTPNLWHYVTAASALLPHWVHRKLANRLRGLAPDSHEPYPTLYRANTARSLRKAARSAGLAVDVLDRIEFEPCYGRCHSALFYPMMAYERIVNSSRMFAPFRVNIHARLVKP